MPVLGVIFLRHAANRYYAARAAIEADQAAGKMPERPLVKADFVKRRAMMLPTQAQFDELMKLPKDANLGEALVEAMNSIEAEFEPLLGQLPKGYDGFDRSPIRRRQRERATHQRRPGRRQRRPTQGRRGLRPPAWKPRLAGVLTPAPQCASLPGSSGYRCSRYQGPGRAVACSRRTCSSM